MIDLRNVDLNLLVSLDALLDTCNVTRAAERLHLSQSSVSAQLARLRQVFEDPLLMPAESGRGMTPTARALSLAAPLRAALKDLEAVVRRKPAFEPHQDVRRFQIAASDNAVVVLGLALMEQLGSLAGPGIQIGFRNADSGKLAEQMEHGEIDLLIGSERMVPPSMKARRLIEEDFVMAQRKGHPRGTAGLDLETYCSLSHVLVSTSGGSFHGFMDEQLEGLQRSRRVALSVQQFTLVPEILRTTDYVSTLPRRLVARFTHVLDAFELPFAARGFNLFAAWHPRNHQDPANVWLRESLLLAADQGNVG